MSLSGCFHILFQECLTEQIQILQGKISVLEDELAKLSQQPEERGEVLGPIVEVCVPVHAINFSSKFHSHLEQPIWRAGFLLVDVLEYLRYISNGFGISFKVKLLTQTKIYIYFPPLCIR